MAQAPPKSRASTLRPPVQLPDWFAQNFTLLGEGELSSEAETSIQYVNHSDDSWRAQAPGPPSAEPKTGQVDAASIESAIGLKRRRLRQEQPGYYLQAAQHLEVVLTANGLIVPSPKQYADEPASKVSHLLLLYAADDGELLLDDYVHNLAFELGCDLMTLDTQDIAQLIVASNQPADLVAEARHLSYDALHRTDSLAASTGDSIFHDEFGEDADDDYSDPFQSMPANNNPRLPVVIGKPITIDISDIFGTKAQRTHSFAGRKPFRDAFVLPDEAKARSSDAALQNVIDRLLSALSEAKVKSRAAAEPHRHLKGEESGPRTSRTMIYIKDLSAIQDSNTNIGHRFLAELYQQVERRRKNGEHIIIVGSESSKLDEEDISSPRWIERLQAPEKNELYRTITLTPILDQSAAAARLRLDRKLRIATINFRHIGEMMRLRSTQDSQPNLGPGFWKQDTWLGQSKQFWASTDLGKAILSFSEVHRIASVLSGLGQGQSPAHSALGLECGDESANLGLNLVQMLLSESDSSKTQWAKKQMSNKKLDQQAPSAEDEKLARVRASATKHEKKLLSGVIEPSKIRTTFNDVHVPVETIDALQTLTTLSLVRPDAFKYGVLASDRIPGLLLYGPPGTGKTLLAKAVAKQSGARVLEVSAADINDMYVGEGEKNVQALFSLAKKLSPCIVFLDEADAMFSARANSGRRVSHRELLNQFLKEWDGMSNDSGSAFIMVATNRPMDLDDAVLRRLPRRLLIDLPTEQDRLEILKIHLRHEKLAEDVQLDQLAKKTPFYSGSDLKNLAVAAALNAVKEENEAAKEHAAARSAESTTTGAEQDNEHEYKYPETRTLTAKHFERALEEITASISEDMNSLKDVKKFDEQYGDRKGKKKRRPLWGFKTAKEADKVLDTVKAEKRLWIRSEFLQHSPDNQRAVLRIHVFPEDVGRADRGSPREFRKFLRWLIPFIDTALATWDGDFEDGVPIENYAVPRSDREESLFYIFNTLDSPSPDVDTFKGSPYALRAMNNIIEDCIGGMKSTLYPYQKRSVAAMLQREERPAFSQDPRKPPYRDVRGKAFYLDIFDGAVAESPELYEEARGGVLAETMGYVVQWQHEIAKHIEADALDLLVLDSSAKTTPDWQQLMKYDIILISKTRFEEEYRDVDTSPMSFERLWSISGTPSHALHGVEVSLPSIDEANSTTRPSQVSRALEQRRIPTTAEQETKDVERLLLIVTHLFQIPPWANVNGSHTSFNWKKYLAPFDAAGNRRCAPGLRTLLQSLMVRHRLSDIHVDLQLPPLYNRTVYLEPSYYDKLTLNLFMVFLISNAVTSERIDEDYMHHPRNRKVLDRLISNLREATFHWIGISPDDVWETMRITREYVSKNNDNISDSDSELITQTMQAGQRALDDAGWRGLITSHDLGVYIEKFPSHAAKAWSMTGEVAEPVLLGTSQAVKVQKYVAKHKGSEYVAEGMVGEGLRAMMEARARARNERGSQHQRPSNPSSSSSASSSIPAHMIFEEPKLRAQRGVQVNKKRAHPTSSADTAVTTAATATWDHELAQTRVFGFTSAKLTYLCSQLLSHPSGTKSIVFYSQDNTAFFLGEALEMFGIEFRIFSHTVPPSTRTQYLQAFNNDRTIKVLLMEVKQAAHGLHVAAASRVYFIGPVWDVSAEAQAIKRAHRIGQTRPVYVETLVLEGTIEARMWQRRKRLSDGPTGGGGDFAAMKGWLDDEGVVGIIKNERFLPVAEHEELWNLPRLVTDEKSEKLLLFRRAMTPMTPEQEKEGETGHGQEQGESNGTVRAAKKVMFAE
ncbi:hypothetical protein DV735_g4618, partial [Chaetothyriales sp. CBS 134920]